MKITNGTIFVDEEIKNISFTGKLVRITSKNNNQICLPTEVVIHCFEFLKFEIEKEGEDFEKFKNKLFEGRNQ